MQAKQLVHSASSSSLGSVGKQLLQRPRDALNSAQQTLETCQANLQQLQQNLQQSLAESRSRLQTLADGASSNGGSPRASPAVPAALGSLFQLRADALQLQAAATEQQLAQQEEALAAAALAAQAAVQQDPTSPWAVLPGYLRAKEIAAIEELITDSDDSDQQLEPQPPKKGWRPLQVGGCKLDGQSKLPGKFLMQV